MCGDKAGRVSPARWTISHYYDPRARSAAGRQRDEKPGWVAVTEEQKPGKQSTLRSLATEDGKAEIATTPKRPKPHWGEGRMKNEE
jgi:hypothetical protein